MKLQLALDTLKMEEALELTRQVEQFVDIIEIGTPFILDYGVEAVRQFKSAFPDKEILADMKIMDGGYYEAQLAFEAGAEYVTVLGVTDILTIKKCVEAARDFNKQIVVDMICVDKPEEIIKDIEEAGVDVIAVHTGADQQASGRTPIEDLIEFQKYATKSKIAVAGGIKSSTLKKYTDRKPEIIIVGTGITESENPVEEAALIASGMKEG